MPQPNSKALCKETQQKDIINQEEMNGRNNLKKEYKTGNQFQQYSGLHCLGTSETEYSVA